MEDIMSKQTYKLVEYNDFIYEIPVRKLNEQPIILWSDILSITPKATCCLNNTKLVPFQLDSQLNELTPKRILLNNNEEEEESVWEIHVPNDNHSLLEQISTKLDYLIEQDRPSTTEPQQQQQQQSQLIENRTTHHHENRPSIDHPLSSSSSSLPTTSATTLSSPNHSSTAVASTSRHEAPPSYETSMLSTVHALTSKLRLFESHIPHRHKSPKWLSKRDAWVSQEPTRIEEVAYLLVQLETALLWTAVTESWIEERETWLTLVGNSRSERHLASAILNLERHTLVLDSDWSTLRERWINELLEMIVLPL